VVGTMTDAFVLLLFGLWWQPATLPPVSLDDLRVFPSHADAKRCTEATLRYRAAVENPPCLFLSQDECDKWHTWASPYRQDAFRRWYIIDDLMMATDETRTVEARLIILERLRKWLGAEHYYNGAMPTPVPFGWAWH